MVIAFFAASYPFPLLRSYVQQSTLPQDFGLRIVLCLIHLRLENMITMYILKSGFSSLMLILFLLTKITRVPCNPYPSVNLWGKSSCETWLSRHRAGSFLLGADGFFAAVSVC